MLTGVVVAALAATGLVQPVVAAEPTALTASVDSGDWTTASAVAGSQLHVELTGGMWVTAAARCTVRLAGPKAVRVTNLRIVDGGVAVPTTGIKAGRYRGSMACGGGKSFKLSDAIIVPKGQSPRGTCTVVEQGFTYDPKSGYVSVGAMLQNSNPLVPSSDGEAIINVMDASGSIIKTVSGAMGSVLPGSTRPSGMSIDVESAVGSVQFIPSCSKPAPLSNSESYVAVPASASPPRPGYSSSIVVGGTVTNSWKQTLNGSSYDGSVVRFVTRNAAGQITGGGSADLNSVNPPPGASVRWETYVSGLVDIASATRVDATLTPGFVAQ